MKGALISCLRFKQSKDLFADQSIHVSGKYIGILTHRKKIHYVTDTSEKQDKPF